MYLYFPGTPRKKVTQALHMLGLLELTSRWALYDISVNSLHNMQVSSTTKSPLAVSWEQLLQLYRHIISASTYGPTNLHSVEVT